MSRIHLLSDGASSSNRLCLLIAAFLLRPALNSLHGQGTSPSESKITIDSQIPVKIQLPPVPVVAPPMPSWLIKERNRIPEVRFQAIRLIPPLPQEVLASLSIGDKTMSKLVAGVRHLMAVTQTDSAEY